MQYAPTTTAISATATTVTAAANAIPNISTPALTTLTTKTKGIKVKISGKIERKVELNQNTLCACRLSKERIYLWNCLDYEVKTYRAHCEGY